MSKIGTATNKKIIELFNMMKEENLILRPSFQRKLVWNNKHKENFIDTILKGYPFPEVYFADGEIDLEKQKSKTLVVDGQQRLHTIYQYITNSKELILTNIKRFPELTREEQTDLFDYNVVVRDLGRISDDVIKDIFNRINSVQYALNAMEIDNALYDGEYISTAKQIIETNLLLDLDIFSDGENSRMKDLEFIILVMTTIEAGGYFASNKEVENYIKLYDDEYPNKKNIKEDIIDILSLIKKLKFSPDSLWLRKTTLFTLIVELVFYKHRKKSLLEVSSLRNLLIELEEKIVANKSEYMAENKFAKFYKYIYQGTASRTGRIARGELLQEFLDKTE